MKAKDRIKHVAPHGMSIWKGHSRRTKRWGWHASDGIQDWYLGRNVADAMKMIEAASEAMDEPYPI